MRCAACRALISEIAFTGADGLPRCAGCVDKARPAGCEVSSLAAELVKQRRAIRLSQVAMGICLFWAFVGLFFSAPLSSVWKTFPFVLIAFGIDRRKTAAAVSGIFCVFAMSLSSGLPMDLALPGLIFYTTIFGLAVFGLVRYHRLVNSYSPDAAAELAANARWMTPSWAALTIAYGAIISQLGFFVLPTGSMEDTILLGQQVVVEKLSRNIDSPDRGDIIAFRYPVDEEQTFLKRIVGVPGDRIQIVDKELWRNGQKAIEPFAMHATQYIDAYRDNFPSQPNIQIYEPAIIMLEAHVEDGEVIVPEGHYFVLGDNRDLSLDSRYWGFVPEVNVIGRLFYRSWAWPWVGSINQWVHQFIASTSPTGL